MPETRSMVAKSANGAETPALASAVGSIGAEAKVLLQPDRPINTDTRGQHVATDVSHHENGEGAAAVKTLPGADPELQSLMHDSPFLDLSSPMTPYEWFKFFAMVSTFCAVSCSCLVPKQTSCHCNDTALAALPLLLAWCTSQLGSL